MPPSFIHPARIPVRYALAVHGILHNAASDADWVLMDEWVALRGLDAVLDDVEAILKANGRDDPREREWWRKELLK